jgi:phage baseplate assembly protein V
MDLSRSLETLHRKIKLLAGRAIVNLVNDSGGLQLIQLGRYADETSDDLERFGEYGLASNPPAGAEAAVMSVGGVRSHGLIIGVEHRQFRMKGLKDGEVALYDDLGQQVYLTRDGIVIHSDLKATIEAQEVIVTANSATVDADSTTVTGDATVQGNADVEGDATVKGNVLLGEGASKFVMLADGSASTKVKAK